MAEETGRCEEKDIEEVNTEKDAYTCNSCGREDTVGYYYCEKCHRKHKKIRQEKVPEEQLEQKVAQ